MKHDVWLKIESMTQLPFGHVLLKHIIMLYGHHFETRNFVSVHSLRVILFSPDKKEKETASATTSLKESSSCQDPLPARLSLLFLFLE